MMSVVYTGPVKFDGTEPVATFYHTRTTAKDVFLIVSTGLAFNRAYARGLSRFLFQWVDEAPLDWLINVYLTAKCRCDYILNDNCVRFMGVLSTHAGKQSSKLGLVDDTAGKWTSVCPGYKYKPPIVRTEKDLHVKHLGLFVCD